MAFVYVPNGMDMRNWTPTTRASSTELPRIAEAARAVQERHHRARQPDAQQRTRAAGRRGRSRPLLRRVPDRRAAAQDRLVDIKCGISCDQIVANKIGNETRFPSLEVGMEDARQAGDCDSGYSCAYTNNLAWRSETQPLPPILDPRALFERLFGNGVALPPEARARQAKYPPQHSRFRHRRHQEAQANLGPTDRRKLDEYLSSIREIERQIAKAETDNAQIDPHMEKPYGVPADFAEHFKLMTDMITVAFQADLTRVLTFLVTREGTSRPYREIGIPDGHHPLTHHRNDPAMMEKVAQINEYQMRQFAGWVEKLKTIKEGDRNLLDNSMIVYGAGFADGNRHSHEDLPTLIAGTVADTSRRAAASCTGKRRRCRICS